MLDRIEKVFGNSEKKETWKQTDSSEYNFSDSICMRHVRQAVQVHDTFQQRIH